jgi:hypothetical protein
MTGIANSTATPKPKRRCYQFSVRTLLFLTTLIALVLSGIAWWFSARAQRILWSVRAHVSEVKQVPADVDVEQVLAGHFSDTTHVFGSGVSGSELYLFPDKTYFYLEWADIFPLTICDKGDWRCQAGFLVLLSDGSTPATSGPRDHEYLPLVLPTDHATAVGEAQPTEVELVLLLGAGWNFSYFLENLEEDPEFRLRLCTYCKAESVTPKEAKKLKDELFKECWRPDCLKE